MLAITRKYGFLPERELQTIVEPITVRMVLIYRSNEIHAALK